MTKIMNVSLDLEKRLHLTRRGAGGIHSALRCTMLTSRIMGLLLVEGLTKEFSYNLRFTYRSPYTGIYIIGLCGQTLMFCSSLYHLFQNGFTMTNITNFMFYFGGFLSVLILAYIGRHWPKMVSIVEEIEIELPPFTRDVAKFCNLTTFLVLLTAVVEHLLSVFYGVTMAKTCSPGKVTETFFLKSMPWIFNYTAYALWKGILGQLFSIQSTFMWSYNDLFIMLISIYLSEHFSTHNNLLKTALKHEQFCCEDFRMQYLKIVRLVKYLNGKIGIYILTSFGNNMYWICMQLFYTLKSLFFSNNQTGHYVACRSKDHDKSMEHTVYFSFSFSFLLVRNLLVLLLAARVHSTSVAPVIMLYEVPSFKYTMEIERYIDQINNIKMALSGLGFFYVTRSMILTLLGTLITYELVLLQFNKNN